MSIEVYEKIADLSKQLVEAQKKVQRTSEARMNLPPGSSRAKVTTYNARWMAICEHRDRLDGQLRGFLRDKWFCF